MRHCDDRVYYHGRFLEEMEHGQRAPSATVAAIHYELAYRYSLLMAQTGPHTLDLALAQSGTAQLAA